jgi:hypothetical protein
VAKLKGLPDRPWGGDAARVTDPDIAAQAMSRPIDAAQSATAAASSDPSGRQPGGNDRQPDRRGGAQRGNTGDPHDEAVA